MNQRITVDAEEGHVNDGRTGDIGCTIEKQRALKTGAAFGLICAYGQESPFNFRTDIALVRTGPRSMAITNTFVDRESLTLNLVRCDKANLPTHTYDPFSTSTASPTYELPPLRDGEFYAGQAYPADYAERRTGLLGDKAKPLARAAADECTHAFCKQYPEIRACYGNGDYCVARWERADGATVDYVVKPDTLAVLKTVCRDTCGADEVRPPVR